MNVTLTRGYHFSASHRLDCEALSPQENRDVYGKCNNPHGHGHNYRVEVTVRGSIDAATGMVMNMADLDALVGGSVVERFHLANLNADPLFQQEVPTTENLCRAIHRLVMAGLPLGKLDRIRIEETENNFFEYAGEAARG
ncbi:MAG TPA: 6-carboxytetrahydropterin synthase [Acidobacteriaceae bacterium]|nr:6-carboxytetrahydropterin synthase [Acidobacteriaceae bacterium]